MAYNPKLKCQALSKRDAIKHRPDRPTLMISIQDGDKGNLPFKERTNHITRSRYVDTLFCYFDDIDLIRLNCQFHHPFLFGEADAKQIINFLDHHFAQADRFEQIIVHCQAGISRSQATALFIAKYYYQDDELVIDLREAPLPDGNLYIYQLLEQEYLNRYGI